MGGLTALLYAARDGCYDCVDELIGAGDDVNLPTPEGVTPLMLALDNDHNDVAKLLLERGANPNLWDWWGRTALYIAIDRRDAALSPLRDWVPGRWRRAQGSRSNACRGPSARFQHGNHQHAAGRRMSIPIPSSICIAPAGEATAGVSSTSF